MSWRITGADVLVTGGTSGIGQAAATELARRGAHVMITARDERKGGQAADAIQAAAGARVQVGILDLSRLESVRASADRFISSHDRLDVLVNNAGTMTGPRRETPDGLEWTFGVNHVGPFLLTRLLTDLLVASAPSRVVSVSIESHRSARHGLDFTDLQMTRGYSPQKAYASSKLAPILMTVELDRRLADVGVTARAVHPGVVATNFGKGPEVRGSMGVLMTLLGPILKKPAQGADPIVLLATAEDDIVRKALYSSQTTPAQPSPSAQDQFAFVAVPVRTRPTPPGVGHPRPGVGLGGPDRLPPGRSGVRLPT